MSTYPRKTTELNGDYLRGSLDWDELVSKSRAVFDGFTPNGAYTDQCDFIIGIDGGGYYYANSAYQTVYGGPTNIGSVDGTDPAEVLQAAVDFLNTDGGGKIAIKSGTYTATTTRTVEIKEVNNIVFQGAGQGCTILLGFCFNKNDNTPTTGIEIRDLTVNMNNVAGYNCINLNGYSQNTKIMNCTFKNANSQFLINWAYVDNLLVEGCTFIDGGLGSSADNCAGGQDPTTEGCSIWRNNIFIKDDSAGGAMLTTGGTGNLLIDGNTFIDLSNISYAAVSIENFYDTCSSVKVVNNQCYGLPISMGNSDLHTIKSAVIANNIIHGLPNVIAGGGIIGRSVLNLDIHDNKIFDSINGIAFVNCPIINVHDNTIHNVDVTSGGSVLQSAIYVENATTAKIHDNIITDDGATSKFGVSCFTAGTYYIKSNIITGPFITAPINFGTGLTYVQVTNNEIVGTIAGITNPTTRVYRDNKGYVTEASGTATGTSPITVTHGLTIAGGYVPTSITVTAQAGGGTRVDANVYNETETTFDIYHDNGSSCTVYWAAQYNP